jgi:3-mercaptopyruvate sulfurtransferase SseA
VRPLVGGFDAWTSAGHPVEHGVAISFVRGASTNAADKRVLAGASDGASR